MNEPLLAVRWDEYLSVYKQLKLLGRDVKSERTTPADLSCTLFSMPVSIEQRIIIKFLVGKNVKPAVIYRRLYV